MTKSTITREQLLEIIETDHVQCGEASYLARMALAAMASEHKRNPVLAYADSYRDMANQGVESVPIWSVITDLERNIAPLYRHAQPVPVVPYDFDFDRFNDVVWLECVASNPHMHSPTTSIIARVALELNKRILAGNSPVIPEGYVMVPKEPTAEMQSAGASAIRIETTALNKLWTGNAVFRAMLAAAPQSHGSEPATVPGKWIPVSERMPEVGDIVLTAMGGVVNVGETECSAANCRFFTSVISGRELPATHWMQLPAAPQEVGDA